jgi:hypothetical protein
MKQQALIAGAALAVVIAASISTGCSNDGDVERVTAPAAPGPSPTSAGAGAPVIRHVPSDGEPGPPFYTPVFMGGLSGFVPTDGTWAAIHFYRQPACIPSGFNLLQVFNPPSAFGCSLAITGKVWRHEAGDLVPFQEHYGGDGAVPIYFVRLSDLTAAAADGLLTIAELQDLALIGHASFYQSVIHNSNQAANHGHETLTARGQLEDGRSFRVHFNEKFLDGQHVFQNVRIEFR